MCDSESDDKTKGLTQLRVSAFLFTKGET